MSVLLLMLAGLAVIIGGTVFAAYSFAMTAVTVASCMICARTSRSDEEAAP